MITNGPQIHKNKNIEFVEVIMIILYNVVMLFHEIISKPIIIAIGVLWFVWFLSRKRNKWNVVQKLAFLACIYVPTSFVSVLGTSYGHFPLTWYHLALMFAYILIIFKGFSAGFYFYSPFLMLFFGILTLWTSVGITDSIKQLLTIVLFIISFFIGEQISKFSNEEFEAKLKSFYLISVFSFSLVVIIQRVCADYLQLVVGYYDVIGENRIVSAGLMNDYSFATLYIATGAIWLVIDYVDNKLINTWKFIMCEAFLLMSILLVNSRTGLFALVIAMSFYLFVKMVQGKVKSIFIIMGILLIIPFVTQYIVENRGGQLLFEGSGRGKLIDSAFQVFLENPIFGIGLGTSNWGTLTGLWLPHNMITQYLAQLGIVGSILLYLNFLVLAYKYLKYKTGLFWVLLTVLIGAMAIPDIVSSRFLSVLIMITIISSANKKLQRKENRVNITS
ncbi:O-antigen ligase family protein [Peribacillus sp. ACCC06369]|uniref:O-antigen ligase family protein n=1 Tax=Peribacillus sp. ACCC06369 TaxID=3055860 RepID=UPI0025A3025B|nr:O-antigen ligase family protein [Peribacillus sp. ACCC06369]MDM5359869.1 O-antigen ligase family protein [Peribacillus sp. ACCC06369]